MSGAAFLLLLGSIAMATANTNYIKTEFQSDVKDSNTKIKNFEKMVLDRQNKKLFVAAENKFMEVDRETLETLNTRETGPKMDNVECPRETSSCGKPEDQVLTNSYCKALLIDYEHDVLIVCTSLFQGNCYRYDLTSLDELPSVPENMRDQRGIVANNKTATTVAFIAPGPLLDDKGHEINALYIGVQYTDKGWQRSKVPAFASRRTDDFSLVHDDISLYKTKINAESSVKSTFPIYYKYGFGSEGFSYMLTVQKESTDTNHESYISKIFRVCQKDKKFVTYAELQLRCQHEGILYNLTQTAHLGKAGTLLAKSLNIPTSEDVLYVTFSKGRTRSAEPTRGSAVCIYPMRYIRSIFTENFKKCFEGIGNTGPAHFFKPNACTNLPVSNAMLFNTI